MKLQIFEELKNFNVPVKKSFLKKKRTTTDPSFILVFALIFSLWLYGIVSVYPSTSPNVVREIIEENNMSIIDDSDISSEENLNTSFENCSKTSNSMGQFLRIIKHFIRSPISTFSLAILIPGFVILGIFMIMQFKAHIWLRVIEVSLVFCIVHGFYFIQELGKEANSGVCTCACIIRDVLMIVLCFCLLNLIILAIFVTEDGARKISRKTCRYSYIFIHRLLLFVAFSVVILSTLLSLTLLSTKSTLFYIILFGGIYITNCIYYYWKMVSAFFATALRLQEEFTATMGLQCIFLVTRYHLGTIAFASTYILPIFTAIFQSCKHRFSASQSILSRLADLLVIFYLIFNVAEYSLIVTALNGKRFFKSTKEAFHLLTKNSCMSISLFVFRHLILVLMIFIWPIVLLYVNSFICKGIYILNIKLTLENTSESIFLYILGLIPFYSSTYARLETHFIIRMYKMKKEDNEINNDSQTKPDITNSTESIPSTIPVSTKETTIPISIENSEKSDK